MHFQRYFSRFIPSVLRAHAEGVGAGGEVGIICLVHVAGVDPVWVVAFEAVDISGVVALGIVEHGERDREAVLGVVEKYFRPVNERARYYFRILGGVHHTVVHFQVFENEPGRPHAVHFQGVEHR